MLEEPDLQHDILTAHLQDAYGLQVNALTFLPLGVDVNAAVYRADSLDGSAYFLKLRKGVFDEICVTLPKYLSAQGIQQVIAPLETKGGNLWAEMGDDKLILYPYIEGQDAYQVAMTDHHWTEFGATVKRIHTTRLPSELQQKIPPETYDPRWRKRVKRYQAQVEAQSFDEPVAAKLAAFMRHRQAEISRLVSQAERFASELQTQPVEAVLCHADLHAGNLHLTPGGQLYIVDWDNPVRAPKEHDLMHIGASDRWQSRHIKRLFYRGYGEAHLNGMAIAYYRCERIIQDIAEFCTQLLDTSEGGQDREQSLGYFTAQFEPGQEVEIALRQVPGEAKPKRRTNFYLR